MRNRALHDALRDFALESAAHLSADVRAGAELSFDVVAEPGSGAVLYRYQALTSEFIGERWEALRQLPACAAAAESLAGGAELYLRVHGGDAGDDSEPALRPMLERLYSDATNFEFPEERFERVYAELERALYESTVRTAIVTPVLGLSLEGERIDLGDGLFLVPGDRVGAPGEVVWPADRSSGPNVLCVLRRDIEADSSLPVAEARHRFGVLLTALRLLKAGRAALGPLAFGRVDDGSWRALALAGCGVGRGADLELSSAEEPELRELVELLDGAAPGPVAWALARFEMGLDRPRDSEALSDYLLALGSLLEVDDEAGRASLPRRLAALCAEAPERPVVQRRVDRALVLEARLKAGGAPLEADGPETPRTLVLELEECLRALLRDVICGYLERNLKAAADDVLVTSGEPVEIAAADLREHPARGREPDPAEAARVEPEDAALDEGATLPPEDEDVTLSDDEDVTLSAEDEGLTRSDDDDDDGVTPSADWDEDPASGWEDDAANWSAPV